MQEFIMDLDYGVIEKASEKYENIKEVFITLEIEGQQVPFRVEVYKYWSPVAIKSCVMELVEKIKYVKRVDRNGFGDIMMPYMMFMCVKHFTTLKLPEDYKQQVLAIENMLNTSALLQIYMSFEVEQLEELKAEVESAISTFSGNIELFEELKSKYENDFKDVSFLEQ